MWKSVNQNPGWVTLITGTPEFDLPVQTSSQLSILRFQIIGSPCALNISFAFNIRYVATNAPDTHYELPDSTGSSVQRMMIGLSLFFGILILAAGLLLVYAQHVVQYIPFSAEQRFIRPYETLISRYFPDISGDSDVAEYLQRLSDSLESTMQVPKEIDITVHYVELEEINAFATLGGHIFVFSGLVEALPDENSLAMVLAHEIAHVAHRDPIASVSRGMALQMLLGFVLSDSSSVEDILNVASGSGLAVFSREQERDADIAALNALNAYYGHVGGYRSFLELAHGIEQQEHELSTDAQARTSHDAISDWVSSHPATEERLLYLDEKVSSIGAATGNTAPLPQQIQKTPVW